MPFRNLEKLIRAVNLLSRSSGATIEDLQEHLGLSRRSVYRMLDTLQETGFPVYDDRRPSERAKRWMLDEDYVEKLPNVSLPKIHLSIEEMILLSYIFSKRRLLADTELDKKLTALKAKFLSLARFSGFDSAAFNKLDSLFIKSRGFTKDYTKKEGIIETLFDAIIGQQTCEVTYHAFSSNEVKKFRIDPLKLVEHDGGLYVFVRITRYGSIRILAVERIKELSSVNERYEYPQDFDPDTLLESSFKLTFDDPVELTVWFSKEQARYVEERRWSPDQRFEKQTDGSIVLKMLLHLARKHSLVSFGYRGLAAF